MLRVPTYVSFLVAALVGAMICSVAAQGDAPADLTPGITVGSWKQFDDFTLEQMLDGLQHTLQTQLNPINPTDVTGALKNQQGQTISNSALSLNVGGTLTNNKSVQTASNQTGVVTPGTPTPAVTTSTSTSGTVENGVTINVPSPTTTASPSTSFGPSARDLLSDSVGLAFDATGLVYKLSDSYNDESLPVGTGYVGLRKVVLGLRVDLHPGINEQDKVAEVRFKLSLPASSAKGITVRYIFPERDTYNVTAVAEHTTGLGLALPVGVLPVGLGTSNSKGAAYLVKDVDTLARVLEPGGVKKGEVEVAWEFRPVLGRRYVDAGARDIYLVLAVPLDNGDGGDVSIGVTYSAAWDRWNRNTGVVEDSRSDNERTWSPQTSKKLLSVSDIRRTLMPQILDPDLTNAEHRDAPATKLTVQKDEAYVVRVLSGENLHLIDHLLIGGTPYSVDSITNNVSVSKQHDGTLVLGIPATALAGQKNLLLTGPYGSAVLEVDASVLNAAPVQKPTNCTARPVNGGRLFFISWKGQADTVRLLLDGHWYDADTTYAVTDLFSKQSALSTVAGKYTILSRTMSSNGDQAAVVALPRILGLPTVGSYVQNCAAYLVLAQGATSRMFQIRQGPCQVIGSSASPAPDKPHQ